LIQHITKVRSEWRYNALYVRITYDAPVAISSKSPEEDSNKDDADEE
jgi:hypothetical protein